MTRASLTRSARAAMCHRFDGTEEQQAHVEDSSIRTLADFQRALGAGADFEGLVGEAGRAVVVHASCPDGVLSPRSEAA